ncbi:serine/threonine-protein kinase [Actinoplanes sp. NPDC051851]|uniref:serine/threonine-protein kinase n=1 Tax=Actinoplanes sp. NPDC051851 TaxID=3154753 RepID=UPI003444016C
MTHPAGDAPATTLDPGRTRRGPGETGADEPATTLDPGRTRRPGDAGADVTRLDPGRTRPAGGGPVLPEGLPAELDARFAVLRRLGSGAEAEVHLVEERASGAERVLKMYREAGPDREVRTFLANKRSRHTVTVHETGTVDGPAGRRGYEVQEHLAGGSLLELRREHPGGLAAETLAAIVGQVAAGLGEVHEQSIVHRDVKPANILVRRLAPLEVAVIDFGIARYLPFETTVTDGSGTVRYMPPEFISGGLLHPAYDWWSLGISVLELATGRPFLELMDDAEVRTFVGTRTMGAETVVDPRLRLLCQGLLVRDPDERWGAGEVDRWLAGESPEVAESRVSAPGAAEAEVAEPYLFADVEYRNRVLLAIAMTAGWEHAARLLFGPDPEPLDRLRAWLRQFPGTAAELGDPDEPPDVRLLRLLRSMAPSLPPVYRGINIARPRLDQLARGAVRGEGNLPAVVRELWRYRLLPLLATGPGAEGLDGGDGLDRADADWRRERARWAEAVEAVGDPGARAALEGADPDGRRRAADRSRTLSLWAVSAGDAERAAVHRELRVLARRLRLDWFTRLVERPGGMWPAYALRDHAEERAEVERAAARRRAWLSRNRRFREWSRRQNRPVALSWAVAGVFLTDAVCALLICLSDILGTASDTAVVDAWAATAFASLAALTVETALAWEIGGRFHPRYSTLGTAFIALGRAARSVAGRGMALGAVAVVLVALGLTVYRPVLPPVVCGVAIVVWAVPRYLRWRVESEREEAEADRGARELLDGTGA